MDKKITIQAAVCTNKGNVRKYNQDNYYLNGDYMDEHTDTTNQSNCIISRNIINLFAVCDGVGGESLGEAASRIVVKSLRNFHLQCSEETKFGIDRRIRKINRFVTDTNNKIVSLTYEKDAGRIGSTMSTLMIYGNQAVISHIGDSKVYLLRNGSLKKMTVDHTEAQRLVSDGILKPEEVKFHKSRSRLTKCFGMLPQEGRLAAELNILTIKKGDVFILCSDGLTDMLEEKEILETFTNAQVLDKATQQLIKLGLENEGADNITLMVVRVEDIRDSVLGIVKKVTETKLAKILAFAASIAILINAGLYSVSKFTHNPKVVPAAINIEVQKDDEKIKDQPEAVPEEPLINSVETGSTSGDKELVTSDTQIPGSTEVQSTVENVTEQTAVPEPTTEPTPIPAVEPTSVREKITTTYEVQKGDTLYNVSRKFFGHIKMVNTIADINNLPANAELSVGQVLIIPEH